MEILGKLVVVFIAALMLLAVPVLICDRIKTWKTTTMLLNIIYSFFICVIILIAIGAIEIAFSVL